jgi:hypothetical protein
MANIIDINECGHIYVSMFALSIFEHKMSEVLKMLGVSSTKLLPGEDTNIYYLAAALKDNEQRDDFHSKVLPFLNRMQEEQEFIVERFNEAEAFYRLFIDGFGVVPSVQVCSGGIRTLQRLLVSFRCDAEAARLGALLEQLSLDLVECEADPLVLAKFLASSLLGKFERIIFAWLQSIEAASATPFSMYGFTSDISFLRECKKKPEFEELSLAVKDKRTANLGGAKICNWI